MVIKKKNGKEEEVQEGWIGRIIPFTLVQETLLKEEMDLLKEKENRLLEITSEYEEIFETLTEEEKEEDYVNENSFVNAEVKKAVKSDIIETETKEKLKKVEKLINEEKNLKSIIKKETELLEIKSKETIENLSDDKITELLKEKWINKLIDSLIKLPDDIVKNLTSEIEKIEKKYDTTLSEIEEEIREVEKSLSSMIDELEGNEFDMLGLAEFKKILGGI